MNDKGKWATLLRDRFRKGTLLTDSSMLVVASVIAGIFGYLFQLYVGRSLGPVSYGIFGSVISLLYIVGVPTTTISTTIAKFVSEFDTRDEDDKIATLIFDALKKLSFCGALGFLFFVIVSSKVAAFLQIPSKMPIILLGVLFALGFLVPVLMGALQGVQMFWHFSLVTVLGALFKLVFAIMLIYLGFGVNGAISSLILSGLVVFFVILFCLRRYFHFDRVEVQKSDLFFYSIPTFLALFFLAIPVNIDVVLVKHYFHPVMAGHYAAASLISKVILFISGPIVIVMFPKASGNHTLSGQSSKILKESLFYVLVLSSSAVIFYFLKPGLVVSLLFGSEYLPVVPLIGFFGLALLFYSVSNAFILYDLAIRKMDFFYPLIFFTVLEIPLIWLFHKDLLTVIKIILISMACLAVSLGFINRRELVGVV